MENKQSNFTGWAIVELSLQPMTTAHPRWMEFIDRLRGPEGCDFQNDNPADPESFTFRCGGGRDKRLALRILRSMGFNVISLYRSFVWFERHGGFCDCEIIWNCDSKHIREEA